LFWLEKKSGRVKQKKAEDEREEEEINFIVIHSIMQSPLKAKNGNGATPSIF